MTHFGGPGPTVHEKRPKTARPCLNCERMIMTTADRRLCPTCVIRAAYLRGGIDEMRLVGSLSERI